MEMEPVQSSNIAAIGYNEGDKTLSVEFRSGKTYRYLDVELETFEELRAAPSAGKFFQQQIRNSYACEQA